MASLGFDNTPSRYGVIYKITNLANQKVYVGQTSTSVIQRWKEHKSDSRSPKRRFFFHQALLKYGQQFFILEVVDEATSKQDLDAKEVEWIERLDSTNPEKGYNCTTGGGACIHGPSSRARQGKGPTPEARIKIAAKQRGRKLSPERREKLIAGRRGKKDRPEVVAERAARTKAWWTPERRAAFGQKQRDEAAAGLRGKFTRANPNIVAGAKRAWETRRALGKDNRESSGKAAKARWQDPEKRKRYEAYWTEEKRQEFRENSRAFYDSEAGKIARAKITETLKARHARNRAAKSARG